MADFFISYSRADIRDRDGIVYWINQEYPDLNCWFDTQELVGGQEWWSVIQQNIRECRIFLFLISDDTLKSTYCLEEFSRALKWQKIIIPIVVRPKTDFGTAPREITDQLRKINFVDLTKGVEKSDSSEALRKAVDHALRGIPTNKLGLEILREIFRDQPELLGEFDANISNSLIDDLTQNLSFARPVNFYLTGRTTAGKSTTSNRFLKVNKVGFGDTTDVIGHSGFGTKLQIFDLPGQAGRTYLENLNRLVLGMPLKDEPRHPRPGEKRLSSVDYIRYFVDHPPERKSIPLSEWDTFAKENKLSPDLILYVFNPIHSFLDTDFQYLVDLLIYLKQQNMLSRLIFLLNEYDNPTNYLEYRNVILNALNDAYISAQVLEHRPIYFIVNAESGQGLDNVFSYICDILPPEVLGEIKDLLNRDYHKDIQVKLLERYNTIVLKTAARIARFLPYEKVLPPLTIYELAGRAFFDLSIELLVEAENREAIKTLQEIIYASISEQSKAVVMATIEPQTIKVAIVGKKQSIHEYRYYDDDDWDENEPWIDISPAFWNEPIYKLAKDNNAPDASDVNYIHTTREIEYEAIVDYQWQTFNGLNDSYLDIEIGSKNLEYTEEVATEIGGKEDAHYHKDPDRLRVRKSKTVTKLHLVPDAVIKTRMIEVKPRFGAGGIPALALLLAFGAELANIAKGHYEVTHGKVGYSDIGKVIDVSVQSILVKLDPIRDQLVKLIASNDRNAEIDILDLIRSVLR